MAVITIGPAQVLKLWKKANERFGPEEDPKKRDAKAKVSDKEKFAFKQMDQVFKGLTALRNTARGGVDTAPKVDKFKGVQRQVVKVMQLFCKTLKALPATGAKDLTKYRKVIRQLTIVVKEMDPKLSDLSDEGNPDLSVLSGVDDSHLDQALEDASLQEGVEISFDESTEATSNTAPPTAPPPAAQPKPPQPTPPQRGAGEFATRLKFLMPQIQKAIQANAGASATIRQHLAEVTAVANAKNFAKAHELLDTLGPLVDQAVLATPAKRSKVGISKTRLNWDSAKKYVHGQITALQKAILSEHQDSDGAKGVKRLQEILGHFNQGLTASLDELYVATTAADENRLSKKAITIATGYLKFVESSPFVKHAQANPYQVDIGADSKLVPALQLVLQQLKATA
jgi:hypothetical protein